MAPAACPVLDAAPAADGKASSIRTVRTAQDVREAVRRANAIGDARDIGATIDALAAVTDGTKEVWVWGEEGLAVAGLFTSAGLGRHAWIDVFVSRKGSREGLAALAVIEEWARSRGVGALAFAWRYDQARAMARATGSRVYNATLVKEL